MAFKRTLSSILIVPAGLLLILAGCDDDPATLEPQQSPAVYAPVLADEPAFTAGTANSIAWTAGSLKGEPVYRAEVALDTDFEQIVTASDWQSGTEATFDGLTDGMTYHYRVRARLGADHLSPWSAVTSSTQDATPPAVTIPPLAQDQTSLTFTVQMDGDDAGSGLAEVELWYAHDEAPAELFGSFPPGEISFIADAGGSYGFHAVGIDSVGNRQATPVEADATTEVPERIVVTDSQGMAWDITNAVHRYNLRPENWRYGLGIGAIPAVIDPRHIAPGDQGYVPPPDLSSMIGVEIDGKAIAYRISSMVPREVIDDSVSGVHLAATY